MQNRKQTSYDGGEKRQEGYLFEQLLLQESTFRLIVEKSQDIIFINDFHGNFFYMNPYGFKILGYSEEDLCYMNYSDLFPDEYKEQALKFYTTQIKNRLEKTYQEIPIVCKDNSLLWFGLNVILVEENDKLYFYGIARNITDRLKIEDALKDSEEKYRTILETMEEGYFEVSLTGDFTFYNKSACELIGGYTMEEFRTMNYKQLMDIDNSRHVTKEFNQVFISGKSRETKFTIINKNHEQRKIEAMISPLHNKDNVTVGFRGIARDVTVKEKILEHLQDSLTEIEQREKKYRLIAENSTDIIWVLDRNTLKFSYLSPSVEKVRGLTVEEGLVESLETVFPQEDLIRVLNLFHDELEKDKTGLYDPDRRITFETRQYKKNGEIIWVEITAKFIRNENGEVISAQGSTRDVSHRKQVEQERDKYAENLATAKLVQQEILPQKPPASDLVSVAYRYMPMEQVGGDYFTFVDFREHSNLGLFIGDVSGHGVAAALYTMTVKAVTDRLFRKYNVNPPRFLEELNNEINTAFSNHFLTGIYGLFSSGDRDGTVNFHFSKGGHPYPALYRTSAGCSEYLISPGRAMGFFRDEIYPGRNIILEKGDKIYLYTDGLIEVRDEQNTLFGSERLLETIDEAGRLNRPLDETVDYILKSVLSFNAHQEQEDDIVLIGIEVR